MTEFDNTNRGVLFKNDRKETETQPDYKGNINVDGKEFWLSGWKKDTKSGPALSLSIQPKDAPKFNQDTVTEDDIDEPININNIPF